MTQPGNTDPHQVVPYRRAAGRAGHGWPLAACLPMLAGATVLVMLHRAGMIFLIMFASCTVLLAVLLAAFS